MKQSVKTRTESEHENVMLLAMSTLPPNPKINTYQVKNEKEGILYFKSISQMEPHTKYVLYQLASRKERLDRIVILASEKARKEILEKWGNETAISFYLKRIFKYLGKPEEIWVERQVTDCLENLQEVSVDLSVYREICDYPEISVVDLENPVFFWEAVQKIRGLKQNEQIHLYMDMQGGDRNAVSQMNAIAELLTRQNVKIKGRYANDFDPKRQTPLHTIREASKEYRTYDLISAMDIFVRYGWGDKLDEYFRNNGVGGNDSKEKRLINAIKDASSAISRCNGDGFDRAVRSIESLRTEFQNPQSITEMDVVFQDIEEDYRPLFDAKYRYVQQIRWCLNKNFLQQALTIFEAKMPYEFVCSGLLYYITETEDPLEFMEKCEKIYSKLQKWDHYRMKDLNHFLIKEYCYDHDSHRFQDPDHLLRFGLGEEREDEVISLLNKYRSLCGLRNKMNHATAGDHNPKGFFCYMRKKFPDDSNWLSGSNKKSSDYRKRILKFLDEWETLANQVPDEIKERVVDLS